MSLLNTLNMFLNYKAWADELTFSSLENVPDSELVKKRDTNFKTIISTLNHVYVIDDIFKAHLRQEAHQYTSRNTKLCPTFKELWTKQKNINKWYIDFISNITEGDLEKRMVFKYVGSTKQGDMSITEILLHIVNHSTYHRGFVSDMMYQIPIDVATNDFTIFLRDEYS